MKYLLCFLICLPCCLSAQTPPTAAWTKVFGGKKQDHAVDVVTTHDGNVAILGYGRSAPAQGQDATLQVRDPGGEVKWTKHFGGSKEDQLNAVVQTADGGFALAGYRTNPTTNQREAWILRTNERGDTLWNKHLAGEKDQRFYDIIETANGELLATGYTFREGQQKMWLYRCYSGGAFKKEYLFGDEGKNEGLRLRQGLNGHIGIAGMTTSGKGNRNIRFLVLDERFKPVTHHIFGSRQWEELNDLAVHSNGGFLLAGVTQSTPRNNGNGGNDFWLIHTNAAGELVWERTFGENGDDEGFGVVEDPLGNILLLGQTYSHAMGANTSKALVYRIAPDGTQIGESVYFGGRGNDRLTAASCLPDGSIIAVGTTSSKQENAQREDGWVIRLNSVVDYSRLPVSQLSLADLRLQETARDGFLEAGEEAYLQLTIHNNAAEDAFDLILDGSETSQLAGIELRRRTRIPYLRAGASQNVRVPVSYTANVDPTDATFQFTVSDVSRNRSEPVRLDVPVVPLNVPSNYLDVSWQLAGVNRDSVIKVYEPTFPLSARARCDQRLFRRNFTVELNKQPYRKGSKSGETGLSSKTSAGVWDHDYTNLIELSPGMNEIRITVDNGDRKETSRILQVIYSDKPNLHVLAIGIDHGDLKYTRKDAEDFAATFAAQRGDLFDQVYRTTLVSNARTPAGRFQTNGEVIKSTFATLRESYQYNIYEQDLLVVFISSHGQTINNRFKIVPSDGFAGEENYVDYAEDILEPLEALACQKLLFVDACHSGSGSSVEGGDEKTTRPNDGRAKALTNLTSALRSTNTIASCQAEESSWEDEAWENGAFTEALIGAFRNEAFEDEAGTFRPSQGDDIVTIAELYTYLTRRVPAMVQQLKKSGTQRPYLAQDQLERAGHLPVFGY
ncbi:caspase family protein [Lewinella sp. 4G2]|uniref:caspase family protein n=1 Tax=Lewinella sp. 4G2 TaxID=1803372 RepID=UPI0007B4DAB0|nr:caspase family protein [Lewinella sp. 4G2]OAV43170.1 hypothetical protein A3850_001065 [Lewinella sp. 4G2]